MSDHHHQLVLYLDHLVGVRIELEGSIRSQMEKTLKTGGGCPFPGLCFRGHVSGVMFPGSCFRGHGDLPVYLCRSWQALQFVAFFNISPASASPSFAAWLALTRASENFFQVSASPFLGW